MRRKFIFVLFLVLSLVLMVIYLIPSIKNAKGRKVDYSGHIYSPDMIPWMVVFVFLMSLLIEQLTLVDTMWGIFFPVFFDLSVYFLFWLLVMPLIRGRFSGKFCAAVWILPNIMYLFTYPSYRPVPEVVFSVGAFAKGLVWVWMTGFVLAFGMHVVSHLKFRSKVLQDSAYVHDVKTLEIWKEELAFSGVKLNDDLLQISKRISAPVTIGVFKKSTVLLLPHVNYTEHQLRMIFRHELVHLRKRDNVSKCFLTFCTAICWFNPFMWKAMKMCAEDMERSCDEAVLYDADEQEREKYAELILDTSVDAKGFSTCLSASASSLRYRLKRIMHPAKNRVESIVLAVLLLLMAWFGCSVAFAYDAEAMSAARLYEEKEILKVNAALWEDYLVAHDVLKSFELEQPEKFMEYLVNLQVEEMSWIYSQSFESAVGITVIFEDCRVNLEVAEIDEGLLMMERYRPEKLDSIYLVRGMTIESFISNLN